MCGRYTHATTWAEVHAASAPLQLKAPAQEPATELNICPTQPAWVLRQGSDGLLLPARLRWGLLPAWAKAPQTKFSTFNARVESVAEKPVFRAAFRVRRCLVPASGWYEWREQSGRKVPHLFTPAAGGALLFAGLWERWQQDDQVIESFTVLTTEARGQVADVHDRMPMLLSGALAARWLDTDLLDAPAFALECALPALKVWSDRGPPPAVRTPRDAKEKQASPLADRGRAEAESEDLWPAPVAAPEQSKLL